MRLITSIGLLVIAFLVAACDQAAETRVEAPNSLLATARISEMSGSSLTLEEGVTLDFDRDLERLFAQSDSFRDELAARNLSPRIEDVVEEYDDRLRIMKRTIVDVTPENADLLEERPADVPPSDEGSPLSEVDDPAFIGGFVDGYLDGCRDGPLCRLSREELLATLEEKDGEYEVVETIDLNKIPIPLDGLGFRLNHSNLRQEPRMVDLAGLKPLAPASGTPEPLFTVKEELLRIGPVSERQRFLNGFTFGLDYGYSYAKSWKKVGETVASIEVYTYLGYGLGLRLPLETTATLSKGTAFSNDPSLNGTVALRTLDLDAAGYRELGVPEQLIYDGKELVLQIGAVSGAKIRLLGQTLFDQEQGAMIDNNRDFTPPLGAERVNLGTLVFPGTETGLYYGADNYYVAANLGLGFDLAGTKVTMRCAEESLMGCPERLVFTSQGQESFPLRILPDEYAFKDEHGNYSLYGIILDDVAYHPRAVFDFKVALEGGINTGKYLFKWVKVTTPWISVYTLGIDLPSLDRHPGTPARLALDQNRVYLRKTVRNATLLLPPLNLTNESNLTLAPLNLTRAQFNTANGSNNSNMTFITTVNVTLVPYEEEVELVPVFTLPPIEPAENVTGNGTLEPISPVRPIQPVQPINPIQPIAPIRPKLP